MYFAVCLEPRRSCEQTSVKLQSSLPVPDGTSGEGQVSSPSQSSWGVPLAFHVCTTLLILEIHQTV